MNLMDTPLCQVPFGEYLKVERTVGLATQFGYAITAGLLGVAVTKAYQAWHRRKLKMAPVAVAEPYPGFPNLPTCMKPPPGYYCPRDAGHDGPCAAIPIPEAP
jgi:hypothetical protein